MALLQGFRDLERLALAFDLGISQKDLLTFPRCFDPRNLDPSILGFSVPARSALLVRALRLRGELVLHLRELRAQAPSTRELTFQLAVTLLMRSFCFKI